MSKDLSPGFFALTPHCFTDVIEYGGRIWSGADCWILEYGLGDRQDAFRIMYALRMLNFDIYARVPGRAIIRRMHCIGVPSDRQ